MLNIEQFNIYLDHWNQSIISRQNDSYTLQNIYSGWRNGYALCNMPSSLCLLKPQYTIMTTNDGCIYRSEASNRKDYIDLNFVQWDNGDEGLEIDLTFKIIDFDGYRIPSTADPYFYENQHHTIGMEIGGCQGKHYWIRLSSNNQGNDYPFSWAFWNGVTSQQFGYESIPSANIQSDVYYTLNVGIIRVNDTALHFNISFNHILYHSRYITINSYNDDNPLNIMRDSYSGYIKIATQYAAAEFKSLYVSGTPLLETIEPCTSSPTSIATGSPTSDPTDNPTMPTSHPTSDPTSDPTHDHTNDPTSDPTEFPTHNPTGFPSTSPILYTIHGNVIIVYRVNMTIILSSNSLQKR